MNACAGRDRVETVRTPQSVTVREEAAAAAAEQNIAVETEQIHYPRFSRDLQSIDTVGDCWAIFYREKSFGGERLIVEGPKEVSGIITKDRKDWGKLAKSLRVGPAAELHIYGKRHWQDRDHVVHANAEVEDLQQVPVGDDFESFRLFCRG